MTWLLKFYFYYACFVLSGVVMFTESFENNNFAMYGTKTKYVDSLPKGTIKVLQDILRRQFDVTNGNTSESVQEIYLKTQGNEGFTKKRMLLSEICKPVQLNFLGRHGIRNPGKSDIVTINHVLEKLSQSSLKNTKALKNLKTAILSFTSDAEKELTKSGWEEVYDIGVRFGIRFPEIFQRPQINNHLVFQATSKSRTTESCMAFMSSLRDLGYTFLDNISERNDLLRFFDDCDRYVSQVENRKDALLEYHNFRNTEFTKVGENIVKRLQLQKGEMKLSPKEVKAIYVMAASEIAIHNTSVWHQYLSTDDLLVLEYAADLKNYWKKSYGYEINYKQACGLLMDIFKHLQQAAEGNMYKKGIMSFAHAETLLPMLALLGLFRDPVPPTANNFHEPEMENRLFRTSKISPFASNLAFVLYTCDTTRISSLLDHVVLDETGLEIHVPLQLEKQMLRLLFNEQTIRFPMCKYDLCSHEEVISHYKTYLSNCDWKKMCSVSEVNDEL